jgi:hypothetical protein
MSQKSQSLARMRQTNTQLQRNVSLSTTGDITFNVPDDDIHVSNQGSQKIKKLLGSSLAAAALLVQ